MLPFSFETGLRKRDESTNIWKRVDVVLLKQFYLKISRLFVKKFAPSAFSSCCGPVNNIRKFLIVSKMKAINGKTLKLNILQYDAVVEKHFLTQLTEFLEIEGPTS